MLIFRGCTERWKPSGYGISLTRNDFIGKMKVKERESRVFQSTLRLVSLSACSNTHQSSHVYPRKIGTILPSSTPFGTASGENLTRANRKRTLVEELVDDAEAKRYAKKKFEELQLVRGARGKNTLQAKNVMRRPKW